MLTSAESLAEEALLTGVGLTGMPLGCSSVDVHTQGCGGWGCWWLSGVGGGGSVGWGGEGY